MTLTDIKIKSSEINFAKIAGASQMDSLAAMIYFLTLKVQELETELKIIKDKQ